MQNKGKGHSKWKWKMATIYSTTKK